MAERNTLWGPDSYGDVVRVDPVERKRRPPAKAIAKDNRVHNRALVLRTLYQEGAMSRSDLARASKLTRPAVSALIAELLEERLASEIGTRTEPRIGKPATLVQIDDDSRNVIAMDLSRGDRIVGAVLNLRGTVVARAELPTDGAVGRTAYRLVRELSRTLVDRAPHPVLGIGIGTPGIIDDEGTVRFGSHLQWSDLPLADELTEYHGVPVFVGNDINMAALGMLHFRDMDASDLIVVSIEDAVGMGVIVNGKLVEGETFAAGEVGHLTVDDDGALCRCGRCGCVEVYVGAAHAAVRSRATPAGHRSEALAAAGRALGVIVAPIATALNISRIVVRGPEGLVTDGLIRAASSTIEAGTLSVVNTSVAVLSVAGDDDLILHGATSQVLSKELGVL